MERFIIGVSVYQRLEREYRSELVRLGYSKNSCSKYPRCVREFLYRLEGQGINSVGDIRQGHITEHEAYLHHRPNYKKSGALSAAMITEHLFSLRLFFEYLERTQQLASNPMSALRFGKAKTPERAILRQEEVEALYTAVVTLRERAMLSLVYGCGLRRGEAVMLNVSDIHFTEGLLYVRSGKGGKRRVLPLTDKIVCDLKSYYLYERQSYRSKSENQSEEAFMLNSRGTRLQAQGYNKMLRALLGKAFGEKAKAAVSLHSLRHSIATHLLENGVKMEYVRDFLGHSSLNITQIYTHNPSPLSPPKGNNQID